MSKSGSGFFAFLRQSISKLVGRQPYKETLVGRDVYGNLFYESNQPNHRGQPTRFHNPTGQADILNKISPEWDAWLRYRRKEPPTEKEVLESVKLGQMKKTNAEIKTEQLIKQYGSRVKRMDPNDLHNEYNPSYPKHKDTETFPGQDKKR